MLVDIEKKDLEVAKKLNSAKHETYLKTSIG